MTACVWCGGDADKPGHQQTLWHRGWLVIAQILFLS